jgi:hypothetical protein
MCNECNKYKSHRLSFSLVSHKITKPLELVRVDLWGPSHVMSKLGNRYYVMFIDDFLRFSWLYTCTSKSQVLAIFINFKLKMENLLSNAIQTLQCDSGTEFKPLMNHFSQITYRVSYPYTLE